MRVWVQIPLEQTFCMELGNLTLKWISNIFANFVTHSQLTWQNDLKELGVTANEGCSWNLAISEGESRGYIEK